MNKKDFEKLYLPNIFSDLRFVKTNKTEAETWSSKERKIAYLVFQALADNGNQIVFREKMDTITDFDELDEMFASYNRDVIFQKKHLEERLNIRADNFAREIKQVSRRLRTKGISIPNPLEPHNDKSFRDIAIFELFDYQDKKGIIRIKVTPSSLKYILYLVHYSVININILLSLNNDYASELYVFFKTIQNKYSKNDVGEIEFDIQDFREKTCTNNKYKLFADLKRNVIDIAEKEINEKTDIALSYELRKSGKKYTHITFKFRNKPFGLVEHNRKTQMEEMKNENTTVDIDDYHQEKNALRSYGISVKAIEKYFAPLTGYKIEHIQQAITRLETEIARGKIIANKPAYFAKVINSVVDDSQALLQAQAHEAEKQQRIEKSNKVKNAWDELDRYISSNEGYVLSIIDGFVRSIPITADEVIEVRDKITELYMVEDIGKIQIPFNSLSKVTTALGEKWSIGAGNIMYFISEANCVNGDASDKIKALKEARQFHEEMIDTVDEKLKNHHAENVEIINKKLLILI